MKRSLLTGDNPDTNSKTQRHTVLVLQVVLKRLFNGQRGCWERGAHSSHKEKTRNAPFVLVWTLNLARNQVSIQNVISGYHTPKDHEMKLFSYFLLAIRLCLVRLNGAGVRAAPTCALHTTLPSLLPLTFTRRNQTSV